MRAVRAFRGPDGNAGGNSNPGDPTKDPLQMYGRSPQFGDKMNGPFPKVEQQ
ncbi:hypothetical protein [Nocardia sp. NPDC051833]|uniref:hypothetical protein n=1 Tax=Nocardia sp. NPDC051833 TaxID=3155674 RepID=UPI00341A6AFB